ncbi:hypothetical protein EP7_004338 [Isosphaeraceae bacterium EP7]
MSIVDRYRNRDNRPVRYTVPYPLENPFLEFTVKRMPMAVRNNTNIDVMGTIKRAGIDRPEAPPNPEDESDPINKEWKKYQGALNSWHAYHLVDQGRDLFVDWKVLDGGKWPTFSKQAFADFVAEMDIDEKQTLGYCYMIKEKEAEKEDKDSKKDDSETASSTPSESESDTPSSTPG